MISHRTDFWASIEDEGLAKAGIAAAADEQICRLWDALAEMGGGKLGISNGVLRAIDIEIEEGLGNLALALTQCPLSGAGLLHAFRSGGDHPQMQAFEAVAFALLNARQIFDAAGARAAG